MNTKLAAVIQKVKAGDANAINSTQGGTNAALIAFYQMETGRRDFRTFKNWKDAGYSVKKGEKGYPIFSRPVRVIEEETGKVINKSGKMKFLTCYLFHDGQVEITKHV